MAEFTTESAYARFTAEEHEQIDRFRQQRRLLTKAQAVRELTLKGLDVANAEA